MHGSHVSRSRDGSKVTSSRDSTRSARLLRSCSYDLSLIRYEPDETVDDRLSKKRDLTPQERLLALLGDPDQAE